MNKYVIIFAVLAAAALGIYIYMAKPVVSPAPGPAATSTSGGGGILPYDSGVRGQVLLGPVCPVERIPPDPNCAPRPYATLVAIFHTGDPVHAFVLTRSDASGNFSAALPPGDYTLGAGESNLPRCGHPQARVEPGVFTEVNISCDTGIR